MRGEAVNEVEELVFRPGSWNKRQPEDHLRLKLREISKLSVIFQAQVALFLLPCLCR